MITLILLLSLFSTSWAKERLLQMNLEEMPPPDNISVSPGRSGAHISWIDMPLDHFDPQNSETFSMRFAYNEDFFGGDGYPIFILVGGEWTMDPRWLLAGNMYEMARENKGYQIYTEHRYYGETKIFSNFTAENLRFLNIDQALADLAYFIVEMKKQPRFADSEVILYGGSYAANMVMWFKKKYPHLTLGTVASSGPILAKVDFHEYLEVVHEAFLSEGGEECIAVIRQGIDDTVAAMQTDIGRHTIEKVYRLCGDEDYDNPYDLAYISALITWTFSGSVQTARPGSLLNICNNFTSNAFGMTPMEKIGGYIEITRAMVEGQCWNLTYTNYINSYANATNGRAWYYQTCTEYGFYQIAPTSGTVFDNLVWNNLEFYIDPCKRIFDERFDTEYVMAAAERVNLIFGGLEPVVNNTINIHGAIDPWRALGVYGHDLSETSPTYTVDRASHCFDMGSWSASSTIEMIAIQQRARRIVGSWLSENK